MKKLTRERVVPIISARCLLADLRDHRFRFPFLAEIGQQQQKPRQALFARIEQLVDEIFFDANVAGQQMRDKERGKDRLVAQHRDHRRFFDANDRAFGDGGRRSHAQWLTGEASLAKEIADTQNGEDRFLALLGQNFELDLAFPD